MGHGKGDVIAIHLFNMPQYVIAYYGILLSGAVFTPISPLLPVDDVAFQLRDSEASALITHERLAGVARQAVEGTGVKRVFVTGDEEMGPPFRPIDTGSLGDGWLSLGKVLCQESPMEPDVPFRPEEDLAHLAYTGGTTGRPKGVMLTHRHVVANTVQYAAWGTGCLPRVEDGGLVLEPVDPALIGENAEYRTALGEAILVNITPWFHAMGTIGYLNHPILTGTTIVLHSRFDPGTYPRTRAGIRRPLWEARQPFSTPSFGKSTQETRYFPLSVTSAPERPPCRWKRLLDYSSTFRRPWWWRDMG